MWKNDEKVDSSSITDSYDRQDLQPVAAIKKQIQAQMLRHRMKAQRKL